MLSKFYKEDDAKATDQEMNIVPKQVEEKPSEEDKLRDYLQKTKKGAEAIVAVMDTLFSVFERTSSLNPEVAAQCKEYKKEMRFLEEQMMKVGEVRVSLKNWEKKAREIGLGQEYDETMRSVSSVYLRCGRVMIEILE